MGRRFCAILALFVSGVAFAAPSYTIASGARSPAALREVALQAQNRARAEVGSPALAWSDGLAVEAATYAREMARTGRFQHAAHPSGPSGQGENLWMGTRNAYSYREMVDGWLSERRQRELGHYTQVVWRGTSRVGCALASGPSDDYLVCRYYPAGNVIGERPF